MNQTLFLECSGKQGAYSLLVETNINQIVTHWEVGCAQGVSDKGHKAVRWEWDAEDQSVAMKQGWRNRHGLDILKDVHVDSAIFYG